MQQADMCYVRTHYDGQQGLTQDQELRSASAALTCNSSTSRISSGPPPSQSRDGRGKVAREKQQNMYLLINDDTALNLFLCANCSWWSLLPRQQQRQRRHCLKQTQRGADMGSRSHLQLLREPEGGAGPAEAQRQLRSDQEPRETQLVVESGAGSLPQVRPLHLLSVKLNQIK